MKDEKIKKIVEKYESATSNLIEEEYLIDNAENAENRAGAWHAFLKHQKNEVPEQFNDKLWDKFNHKTQSKRKLIINVLSVAATVLLFVSLYFGSNQREVMSYEEKAALLNKAIEMTSNQDEDIAKQDIIYEDQTIIIYTKTIKN